MPDIHSSDHNEYEYNDSHNNAIELSQYTTMESLMEALKDHYSLLERFEDIRKEHYDHYDNFKDLFDYYQKILTKDEEDFEAGQIFPQYIQEKISDIQTHIDYITSVYIELTSKFEGITKYFNDPNDHLLHKTTYEHFLEDMFDVCLDMGDILVSYENLIKYNDDE